MGSAIGLEPTCHAGQQRDLPETPCIDRLGRWDHSNPTKDRYARATRDADTSGVLGGQK